MTKEAADAIQFAIDLIQAHGHQKNEECHKYHGDKGYCVGMSVILGAEATGEGKTYHDVKAAICRYGQIWHGDPQNGFAVNIFSGFGIWQEARQYVAWAWGLPKEEDPGTWGDDAAVTPNQYSFEHGISPIPYLENAKAMALGAPLPHALKPLPCWWTCNDCDRPIRDFDGFCEQHNPFLSLQREKAAAMN